MPLSERMRDPRFRKRSRRRYGSIYGYGPKLSFGSGDLTGSSGGPLGGGGGVPPTPVAKPPSFGDILASDPLYQYAYGQIQADSIADAATRDENMRRALIQFGGSPGAGYGGVNVPSVFDPATRSLAEQNTKAGLSILARLTEAAQTAKRRSINALGARGMFRSGETGFALNKLALDETRGRADATSQLLDYLAGIQAAWAASERARKLREQEAAEEAAGRAAEGTYSLPMVGDYRKWVTPSIGGWNNVDFGTPTGVKKKKALGGPKMQAM